MKVHTIDKSGADATTTGRLLRHRTVSVNAGKGEYKSTQQDQSRPTEGDKKIHAQWSTRKCLGFILQKASFYPCNVNFVKAF